MLSQIIKSIVKRNEPATIAPLGTSSHTYRVWPHQIDYNLHLNNAKYLNVLEHARWVLFRENGWFKYLFAKRLNVVVASFEITFIRELNVFTQFEVRSRVLSWDEKYMYVEQRILVKGKLSGHIIVKIAGVRKGKRALTPEICEIVGVDYNQAQPQTALDNWAAMTQAKRQLGEESI